MLVKLISREVERKVKAPSKSPPRLGILGTYFNVTQQDDVLQRCLVARSQR